MTTPDAEDASARAACREICAEMGEPPCWQDVNGDDAVWPNPACENPACKGADMTTTPETLPDLKPCPFCGAEAYLVDFEAGKDGMWPTAREPRCGAGCGFGLGYFRDADAAIAAWNRRPDRSPAGEVRDDFDKVIAERDAMEGAFSAAYEIIMGRGMEWTSAYDTPEALSDMAERVAALSPAPAPQHPDDAAVNRFAAAMKAKMARSRVKGRDGWDDPALCSTVMLAQMLQEHVTKTNPGAFEDIACLAMMLHQRGDDPACLEPAPELHHYSSCAVHNAPAYEPGPCDCGGYIPAPEREGQGLGLRSDGTVELLQAEVKRLRAALAAHEEGEDG